MQWKNEEPRTADSRFPIKRKTFIGGDLFDWTEMIIGSILLVVVLLTFFVRINEVNGISMEPSLRGNDRLLVLPCFYSVRPGDIVIAYADNLPNQTEGGMGESIVKRVIAVGGDTVDICPYTGNVTVNGQLLDEPYVKEKIAYTAVGNQDYPLIVPTNAVFLLGDNRNHSTDSRWKADTRHPYYVDCVDRRYLMGKVVFRLWPDAGEINGT